MPPPTAPPDLHYQRGGSIGGPSENSPSAWEEQQCQPWGTKAPRPEPRRLTDGREEEPSLVDGRDPLLLIVADGDLGGVRGGTGGGQESQAGRPAGTTSQSVKPIGSNRNDLSSRKCSRRVGSLRISN